MKITLFLLGLAYLAGSLPSAFLIVKFFYAKNIYTCGSGNGGATNVYRLFGKKAGITVFLVDFFKGFLPIFFVKYFQITNSQFILLLMIISALIGHTFPIWTKFKGGKGVAVSAGALTALVPIIAPFCLTTFIITIAISKYVSLASMNAAISLPIFYAIYQIIKPSSNFILTETFFSIIMILVLFFHRKNILRLLHRKEPKIKR